MPELNWMERTAAKMAISRLRAKLGEANMGKLAGYAVMVLGAAGVLSGLGCLLQHLAAGDVMDRYQHCVEMIVAGAAAFSPGLGKLKVDRE